MSKYTFFFMANSPPYLSCNFHFLRIGHSNAHIQFGMVNRMGE